MGDPRENLNKEIISIKKDIETIKRTNQNQSEVQYNM